MSRLELRTECDERKARLVCVGRIVAGNETDELEAALGDLLRQADVVDLDLEQVTFLDSSGLGVLVRNLLHARAQRKQLRMAAMSDQVRNTFTITNMLGQFESGGKASDGRLSGRRILFVHPSAEIRTFTASLLRSHGATVQTCASMYDARVLGHAGSFDLLVAPAEVETDKTAAAKVLVLESGFFEREAERAGEALLLKISEAGTA